MSPEDSTTFDHTPAYPAVDLVTCESEPIHVPGAIQPHGFLLALDDDLRIVTASRNSDRLIGLDAQDLLGTPVSAALGTAAANAVTAVLRSGELSTPVPAVLRPGSGKLSDTEVDLIVHRSGQRVVVEAEPVETSDSSPAVSYRTARTAMARLTDTTTTAGLCQQLAAEIRQITGFDRVMVYRFDEEWNGEVVAEEKRDDLNPFLGLHYPATDIPAQARRLYTVNWTRLIADIAYEPVPLEPVLDPDTRAPLDLSHSVLRSVSPIHVEYLSNMGVSASMSVSMIKDGELWGLVACHHYSGPLRVPYDARSAAEFLGQTASHLIDDRERADSHAEERAATSTLAFMTAALAADPRPVYDTLYSDRKLLELVDAQGAALWADGRLLTLGDVPPGPVLHAIARAVGSDDGSATASSQLGALSPELSEWAEVAAGALHIGNGPERWMMWLRPEVEKTVEWGGDPNNKALAAAEGPQVRLSPRKSFEKWRQVVRGQSLPWRAWQLDVVERLRKQLAGELLRRTHEHTAIAESLQRTIVLDEAPSFDGLDVLARYRPAKGSQLGGDWWDAFTLPDGRVVLAVGDVAGHGVSAATAMAQIRTGLRAYMVDGNSPAECVDRLDVLARTLLDGQTATVVVLAIDPRTGRVELANAGHPPPIVLRHDDSSELLPPAGRPLLGIAFGSARTDELVLAPGDVLLMYTDGLVERHGIEIDESIDRLRTSAHQTARTRSLDAWIEDLLTAVPGTLDDDLTVVAVRPTGDPA